MQTELKFTPLEFETSSLNNSITFELTLKFTPLEFETQQALAYWCPVFIKIYSVGVWNIFPQSFLWRKNSGLKFTPLEFETFPLCLSYTWASQLKFTPLEFETISSTLLGIASIKLKFTPLEFETLLKTKNKDCINSY